MQTAPAVASKLIASIMEKSETETLVCGSITSLSALFEAFCICCSARVSRRKVYNSLFSENFRSMPNSFRSVTGKADAWALAREICSWFSRLARLFALLSPLSVSCRASLVVRTLSSRFFCKGFNCRLLWWLLSLQRT